DLGRVELLQLFADDPRGKRQVAAFGGDILLALLAQDVAQEFLHARIAERGGDGRAAIVDRVVDVNGAVWGIAAVRDAPAGESHVRARARLGEIDRLHAGIGVSDRDVCDAERITAEVGDQLLAVGVFAQALVPHLAAAHDTRLEIGDRTGAEAGLPIGMDRLV